MHGGIANECRVEVTHVDSEKIEQEGLPESVLAADGILVPMGFGPRGTEGKIAAVRHAREKKVPFFGICFGMQMAVIEYARHVCGLERANSTEVDPKTPHPVIDLLPEQRGLTQEGRHDAARRLSVRGRGGHAAPASSTRRARSRSGTAIATSSTTPIASSSRRPVWCARACRPTAGWSR